MKIDEGMEARLKQLHCMRLVGELFSTHKVGQSVTIKTVISLQFPFIYDYVCSAISILPFTALLVHSTPINVNLQTNQCCILWETILGQVTQSLLHVNSN